MSQASENKKENTAPRGAPPFAGRRGGPMGGGPMGGGRGGMPGDRAQDFSGTIRKLLQFLRPYLPWICVALVLALIGTVFTIIGPDYISQITDLIVSGLTGSIDLEAVGDVSIFMVVLYGLSALFSYTQGFIMTSITQRVSKRMRTSISSKINRLPLKYFDSTSYGDILSRITNDVDTIGQTLNQSIVSLVTSVTMFIGALVMMISTQGLLALVSVLSTLFGFALMAIIMRRSQKYFMRQQQGLGEINGHVEEIYSGHSVVKAYNAQGVAHAEFTDINDRLRDSTWKASFLSGLMMPLMNFIGNLGYLAVCVVGGMLVMNQSISFGVVIAFMIYVRLFTQPLSQIAQAATTLQSTAAAGERVFEFLEEKELEDESAKTVRLPEVHGDVRFEHVKFGYDEDKTIIKDFSLDIKRGQKIAIVGPTGAGKTTIVNLLMRFYEVNSGQISIDSVPIQDLTRENVHDLFCMVLQDTWLFEGTIRENVAYSKADVTDEQVIQACKAVSVDHFIRSLPDAYDTVLSDADSLSMGERQLMTIARAMVKDAPMLILDEATSSVDTRTEIRIQEAMDRLMSGRTSFIIAHRLSTIKNADMILVLNDGDVIESGQHDDLLARQGFYAQLYNSQFERAL